MARPSRNPKYRLHKARNLAAVTLDGKIHYLGEFESPESYRKYDALLAEWHRKQSLGPVASTPAGEVARYTCGRLAADYLVFAQRWYVKNGEPTSQIALVKQALKALVALYETEPAVNFGPVKLKNLQQYLVDQGKSRVYVNKLVACLKVAFKWAASEELVAAATYHALQTVGGLKKGRTQARETDPVRPVAQETIDETLKFLSGVVGDMIRLQLLTGMRPGEVVGLRPTDVTRRTDGSWAYRPGSHKTEHHGKERCIFIGPAAQEVLLPYLLRDAEAYCFSPAESVRQYYTARRTNRKSRITPSQRCRQRKAKPRRPPTGRYSPASYRRAIERACEKAFKMPEDLRRSPRDEKGRRLPESPDARLERLRLAAEWREAHRWSPNQLRHTKGTELRQRYGIEAARVVLGHSNTKTTEIYAERDLNKAAEIMQQIG
jgi:integrase